jgi:hypothetical protein
MAKEGLLYPLNNWMHWVSWFFIAGAVAGVTFLILRQWQSIFVFASWFFVIALADWIMHKTGFQ